MTDFPVSDLGPHLAAVDEAVKALTQPRPAACHMEQNDPRRIMSAEHDELFQLMLGRTTTKAVERVLAAGYRKPRLEYGIFRKRDSMDYQEPFDPAVFDSVEKAEEYKRANYKESGWPWLEIRSRPAPGAWTKETP